VVLLTLWSASEQPLSVLAGDAMFLGASALAALYVLQLRRWGIGPLQGAAIVSFYSALVVVPCCLWSAAATFHEVSGTELLWQVLWQGVLIGCLAVIALNQAIARLGAERSSALVAAVPVLTAALGLGFLGEVPSATEMAAFVLISAGVSIAAAPRATRATPLLPAPPQTAPRVGYPVRDSGP
jgi:drug/metabolite transporter (DMT)-like permease